MTEELTKKLYQNALISERLGRLDKEERQKVVLKLLENKTNRQLAKEIGVPHSTIQDWKSLRQSNAGGHVHVSLNSIYTKLKALTPEEVKDWGRIEMIHEICKELISKKP